MNTVSYQNARITSINHYPDENKLILGFEDLPDREFSCVVDFSLNGFFANNVLFGIDEYRVNTLPARIAAEFPVLSYYIHTDESWQIFHLSPAAGLGGVIVCAVLE